MVKLLAGGNLEILKYCFGRGLEPGRRRIRGLIAMIQEQSSSRAVTRSCTDGDSSSSDNRGHFHQSWILQWTSQTISIFTNCIWNLKASELIILTLVGTRRQEWRHPVAQFLWLRKHCITHNPSPSPYHPPKLTSQQVTTEPVTTLQACVMCVASPHFRYDGIPAPRIPAKYQYDLAMRWDKEVSRWKHQPSG